MDGSSYTGYGSFEVGDKSYNVSPAPVPIEEAGELHLLVHHDCYDTLMAHFGYRPLYKDIIGHISDDYNQMKNLDYGVIKKYQGQDFSADDAFVEAPYLLRSPLVDITNKDRIVNLWNDFANAQMASAH